VKLQNFARELSMLSHNFQFETKVGNAVDVDNIADYGILMMPALLITGVAGGRVRFYGVPTVHEIAAMLKAIKEAAQGKLELSTRVRHRYSNTTHPIHIQILVPGTSVFCPDLVSIAQKLAFAYHNVTVDVINTRDFPEWGKRHGAQYETKVFINGRAIVFGLNTESSFADNILTASQPILI
jgi:predicted RNase H-related nuclease YkuK (DUF458 family)